MEMRCDVTLNHLLKSLIFVCTVLITCNGQREAALPITPISLRQILRTKVLAPDGRTQSIHDIKIQHYRFNSTKPLSLYLRDIKRLLDEPSFDLRKPTVLYSHGYLELTSDISVRTIIKAYTRNRGYNILILDWSNLAFGNYLTASLNVQLVGVETGKAVWTLLKEGLSLEGLHLVGHSLGAHVVAVVARQLANRRIHVPRISGLDPAYPGFYPSLFGVPVAASDAVFVDVIHTDGGGYGAPDKVGHADFWPNEGKAKQPGCLSVSIPLSYEDFCSHWRSWAYWAESLNSGQFLARQCDDYDTFLRGKCQDSELVHMGLNASSKLNGNFYLRTAAKKPFALAERGAE